MERLLKKYEQKYRRAKEQVADWRAMQDKLLKLFGNACSILERLPVLVDEGNYGVLKEVDGMLRDLPAKQVETLECIFQSMQKILIEFEKLSISFKRLWQDGRGLLSVEKLQPTPQQLKQCIGSKPSLNDCLEGLRALHIMHQEEYQLKLDIVSSLSYTLRSSDLTALQTLLAEQPNLPPDEVQHIFNLILGGESEGV